MENSMEVPQKNKNTTTMFSNFTSPYLLKKIELRILKRNLLSPVQWNFIYDNQDRQTTQIVQKQMKW